MRSLFIGYGFICALSTNERIEEKSNQTLSVVIQTKNLVKYDTSSMRRRRLHFYSSSFIYSYLWEKKHKYSSSATVTFRSFFFAHDKNCFLEFLRGAYAMRNKRD